MSDKEDKMKNWKEGNRIVLQCLVCDDEVFSRFSGEYKSCQCGAIAIDQTPYYYRIVGDHDTFMAYEKKVKL